MKGSETPAPDPLGSQASYGFSLPSLLLRDTAWGDGLCRPWAKALRFQGAITTGTNSSRKLTGTDCENSMFQPEILISPAPGQAQVLPSAISASGKRFAPLQFRLNSLAV